MAAIKITDLFAAIGVKADVRQLNRFQKRLAQTKKQLLGLKRLARTPLSPNTNIAAVRTLNTELGRTLRLARQIQNQGPIRVRRSGVAGGGGAGAGGRGRGGGIGPAGFFGGALAAGGAGRTGLVGRTFVGGFTATLAIRKLFQANAAMQGIEVALAAITREGQTTGEVMEFLISEADRLGFEFSTSALEFAKLAAAGNAAGMSTQQIQELFIGAQEAARVFNLTAADTEGVLKAFTQIVSKGKVTAEELRNQLGDRLPAAVPIFAAALGVTTQELSAMLEKGEILANDALPKFGKQLRATFAPQVAAAANNITAKYNRFLNTFFFFLAEIGKAGITDIFGSILSGATNALKVLTPVLKVVIRAVQGLIAPFRAFGRILERPIQRVPKLASLLTGLVLGVVLLRSALLRMTVAWVVAFAPVLATAAGLAALVLLIEDWLVALEGGNSIIGKMAGSTNALMAVIGGSLINIGKFVEFLGQLAAALVTGNFDELTASFQRFVAAIADFFRNPVSDKLADMLEFFLIDQGEGQTQFDVARSNLVNAVLPSVDRNNSNPANFVVEVTGDTSVISDVVVRESDNSLRQAQADFPDNE